MRLRAAAVVLSIAIVAGVVIWGTAQIAAPARAVQLQLTSAPFPSSVGNGSLIVSLTDEQGAAVESASVQLSATMMMPGMLPLAGHPGSPADGLYPQAIMWSMPGEWVVDVTAALPDGSSLQEQFKLYVYPIPPSNPGGAARYRSVSEVNAAVTASAASEWWIVIPQGTQTMMRTGQGEDVIPSEIRLSLNGQRTLVIRNDDIADHTVGPFFVRAGETIRQKFTRAAEYVGTCTIRHGAEVSIIVE
jgi:hypothetical protein